MGWTVRGIAVVAALGTGLGAGPVRGAGGGVGPGIRWVATLEAGRAEAKSRGVPFLVALNMDGEHGNEEMVEKVYADPVFAAAAAKCVCTIGSLSGHDEADDPASGRRVCRKFGSLTCREHQAVEHVIRTQWLKKQPKDDVNSPQHFFFAPDGRRLFHRTWTADAKELAALLARAAELSTPASLAGFDTLESRLKRAADPLAPVREEAVQALAALKDPAVDGKLVEMAKGAAEGGPAADVLDAFAAALNPARLALAVSLLGAKSPEVRMHAVVAVEASKDPASVKELAAALGREKDPGVRGVLYRAVAGCAPADPAAKALVLGGLKEKGDAVLPHVLVALAPWAADPAVTPALKAVAFGKDDWRVRAAACWSLGFSGHRDLIPGLEGMKDDSRGRRLSRMAQLAARRISEGADDVEYRRALKGIAPTPIRHPGDLDE